ncbi:MAG TPA: hypothetical protein TECP_00887 [Hyphomicrobiaceae bacterium MAG_BT-2024]
MRAEKDTTQTSFNKIHKMGTDNPFTELKSAIDSHEKTELLSMWLKHLGRNKLFA